MGSAATEPNPRGKVRRPLALTLVSLTFLLAGAFALVGGIWSAGSGAHELNLEVFLLPIGLGLFRLRWNQRRYALACIWVGYALCLFTLYALFARADGVTGSFSFAKQVAWFGWQPNSVVYTWWSVVSFVGVAALLRWMQVVLLRPEVRSLFEQQRGRGVDRLETLVGVAVCVFTFGLMSQVDVSNDTLPGSRTWFVFRQSICPGRSPRRRLSRTCRRVAVSSYWR